MSARQNDSRLMSPDRVGAQDRPPPARSIRVHTTQPASGFGDKVRRMMKLHQPFVTTGRVAASKGPGEFTRARPVNR